jgi:2-C-methyl-D-erythritol 2,4-cyclodiphosphate synthase
MEVSPAVLVQLSARRTFRYNLPFAKSTAAKHWEDRATLAARIGIGHDTHRLTPGGPLRLGGIDVPHDQSLAGHSDADVLLHAITDALLGAAALGDIGERFPDTDPANRGRDSADMLERALDAVTAAGFQLVNVDSIVFAERPKLSAYKTAIRERIAAILDLPVECVGFKAKTGERVGPVGRQEAMMAEAVVLLERLPTST